MVGNEVGGSQTAAIGRRNWGPGGVTLYWCEGFEITPMAQGQVKPHEHLVAGEERRADQTRLFRRNQIFGLLLIAAAIFVYWVIHTKPGWVLPAGWWRP